MQNGWITLHIGVRHWDEFWSSEAQQERNVKVIAVKDVELSSGGRVEAKRAISVQI